MTTASDVGTARHVTWDGTANAHPTSRLRIAQVMRVRLPHPIALSLHAVAVCESMARLGHQVELVVPAGRPPDVEGPLPDLYEYYGVRRTFSVRRVPYLSVRRCERSFEIGAALYARARRFDLCYVNDCARAALYACRLGQRTVFHTHQYPKDARGLRTLDRLFAHSALARVITNTEALARLIRANHQIRCDVRVVYNGVDVQSFGALDAPEARRRLALPDRQPIVCYLGHLYPGRGVDELIEAAAARPEVLFLVVGGMPADIEKLTARLSGRIPSNVRLLGFVPRAQVPEYLSAADVLVMPYTTRTMVYAGVETTSVMNPMKMFEYMASARPIVATRLPALEEVLADGRNAVLVDPDSAAAIRDGIDRLLRDKTLATRIARRAREDALARHSWDAHAAAILEGLT